MSSDPSSHPVTVDTRQQTSTPEIGPRRPYGVVFIADFGTAGRLDALTNVDKEDFAAVLKQAAPEVALAIAPPNGGADWEFRLRFDSLKSFEPAGFLPQISGAQWRLGLRAKLQGRRKGESTPEQLEAAVRAAVAGDSSLAWLPQALSDSGGTSGAAPTAATAPAGGSILDMVDAPDSADKVSGDVERMARQAGDPNARIGGSEAARLGNALQRVDRELTAIADAVLKHPDVRRLETAWRGLKFMVDRVEFRDTGVRLSILHSGREGLADRLSSGLIDPAFEGEIETPGMLVVDHEFARTPEDLAALTELAGHAASLPVPLVYPVPPTFFEVKGWRLVKNLPNLSGLIDGWEYAKWRTLRDEPTSRWLVPVVGRFILRAPYVDRPAGEGFTYTESVASISDVCWAHGHLAMAICSARSHASHGWPTRMFGSEAGKIGDLPVVDNPASPGEPWGPGDLFVADRRLDEFPEIGFNLLTSVKNADHCLLLGGVCAARPVVTQEVSKRDAALEISLPYQQFSSIASAYVCELMPGLRGLDPEKIKEQVLFGLAGMVGIKSADEMEAVQVATGVDPDAPGKTIVQIRLEPPGRIVPGGLKVEFGFSV